MIVRSLIIPGLGHFRVHRPWRGLAFVLGYCLLFTLTGIIVNNHTDLAWLFILVPLLWLLHILSASDIMFFTDLHIKIFPLIGQAKEFVRFTFHGRRIYILTLILFQCIFINPPFLFGWWITGSVAHIFSIRSNSMEPNFPPFGIYLLDKAVYRQSPPQRGDVIVFDEPATSHRHMVKRIVATGGETVEIKDGDIWINGERTEIPGAENVRYFNRGPLGRKGKAVKVPEGYYYVLGDNSAVSLDSRIWGFVPREAIKGKGYPIWRPQ